MPNLAMRRPASQYSRDGIDLSWPLGGEREVVAVPDEKMTLELKLRIAEGQIVMVDDKPTKTLGGDAREYRLLTGEDARKHMAEPAGPVTRVVYSPATPEDEQDYQLAVQDHKPVSDRFIEAQRSRAEAAEERHADVGRRQAEAEKKAAKDAKARSADEMESDPVAERLRRTEEANAPTLAAREKAFMEREKARQKLEEEELKHFAARSKVEEDSGDAEADKAFMEREKARQKLEAEEMKEREKAAKDNEDDELSVGYAGRTDPIFEVDPVGRRPGATIVTGPPQSELPKAERVEVGEADASPVAKAEAARAETAAEVAPAASAAKTETKTEAPKSASAVATKNLGASPSKLASGSKGSPTRETAKSQTDDTKKRG